MRPGFRRWLVVGFALTAAVLAANSVVSMRNIGRLAENNRRALRTAEALRHLDSTLSTLKDAETGQRGYLLTGRDAYLAPYEQAVGSIAGDLRRLEGLLDDPEQQRRLEVLGARVAEKLDEMRLTVNLRRRDALQAATAVVLSDRGRRAMLEIRRLVNAMEEAERAMLASRIGESEASLGWATSTFAIASIAAVMMVATLGVVVARHLASRHRSERALLEADRRKDEFLAMLAHELRNPVAAIRSAADTLGRAGDGWAEDVIDRQVDQLSHLLDDLLDVARITRGLVRVQKEPVEVGAVVRRAVESVRRLIDERRHRLEVTTAPGPLWIQADPVRLEQVLVNLLENAAQFTPPGGRIRLDTRREADRVVLEVGDDGAGIPPEILPRVFDLFAQGDRTPDRSEGGLGIGLTVVRKLVELHDGTVSARSEGPGKGSAFVVTLPAAEAPAQLPPPAPAPVPPPANADPRRTRILIVDDNQDLARGMARLLELLGHDAEVAYDGPEGIEAARRYQPDVILLDIGLPGLDGYFVARALRQEGFGETLIIAISGYGQEEDRRRSLEAGMDHHLTKPVDIKAITALIAQPA